MGRRTLLLIAALLIAALGTALIWLYVQGADDRARAGLRTVSVYTAGDTYKSSTKWADIRVGNGVVGAGLKDIPQSALPENALTVANLSQVEGKVLLQRVDKQAVLTVGMFGDPGDATSTTGLKDDMLAIEVSLEDPARVAGLLRPGSEITIFATSIPEAVDGKGAVVASKIITWVFLDKVTVLSSGGEVGTVVAQPNGRPAVPQALVGLQVSSDDAQKIILTQADQTHVRLWFALRGANAKVELGDSTNADELLREIK